MEYLLWPEWPGQPLLSIEFIPQGGDRISTLRPLESIRSLECLHIALRIVEGALHDNAVRQVVGVVVEDAVDELAVSAEWQPGVHGD